MAVLFRFKKKWNIDPTLAGLGELFADLLTELLKLTDHPTHMPLLGRDSDYWR